MAVARTSLTGVATLNYTKYDAEGDGRRQFSGNTLTQQYSIDWHATNLVFRDQRNYYSLMAGYDWTSFRTTVDVAGEEQQFKDSYGKFRYNGAIRYTPPTLPFRFQAYMTDDNFPRYRSDDIFGDITLIYPGLVYALEGRGTSQGRGFTVDFYPDQSIVQNLRGLPRIHFDYKESRFKGDDAFSTIDLQTREYVAAFNKGSNWLNYRSYQYENYFDNNRKYEQQQLQIGHVDYQGRRQWAMLTNWIIVSADGQLLTTTGLDKSLDSEEYDVNLQAIATRRNWEAKTFMNYNRELLQGVRTEQVRVPLYVKGVWGADADWYLGVAVDRSRQKETALSSFEKSYSNTLTAGGTLFRRASFTLSPSLLLRIDKSFYGVDSYEAAAGVETASTSRFSNKLFVTAGYLVRTIDDGNNTAQSTTWSNRIFVSGKYLPSNAFSYELTEAIDVGTGNAYITDFRYNGGDWATKDLRNYLRSTTTASVAYRGNAAFNASVTASYDLIMNNGLPNSERYLLRGYANYSKESVQYNFGVTGERRDNGIDPETNYVSLLSELLYRPNRYQEGLLRYTLDKNIYSDYDDTKSLLLQRQTFNYFDRTGVGRNIASITQEFSYLDENGTITKYLSLYGRYSPTSRLTLNGSVKYQSDPGSETLYYGAGIGVDFKLLSASLGYELAKRNSDNRTEKKLTASATRSF